MADVERGNDHVLPVTDRRDLYEVLDKVCEVMRSNFESDKDIIKASGTYIEKASTFYERMIVADGAIIALSLSFLGTMIGRSPIVRFPRHEFYSLVCTSWVLLLLSIVLGLYLVAGLHNVNATLVHRMWKLSDEYYGFHFGMLQLRLSQVDTGAVTSKVREQIANHGRKAIEDAAKARAESDASFPSNKSWQRYKLQGGAVMLFTMLAVLLLCVFTVRNLPLG